MVCCALYSERKSNPVGKAQLKSKTVMPFYFSVSAFSGDLSYPLEQLQVRQVVTLVVDYVMQ